MRSFSTRRPMRGAAATAGASRAALLFVAFTSSACGGPSVPSEVAPTSPLARGAESAPLPEIGSSFEDTPVREDEAATGHQGHGGHAGHTMPADTGHAAHTTGPEAAGDDASVDAAGGTPDAGAAPGHPRGHHHAH